MNFSKASGQTHMGSSGAARFFNGILNGQSTIDARSLLGRITGLLAYVDAHEMGLSYRLN